MQTGKIRIKPPLELNEMCNVSSMCETQENQSSLGMVLMRHIALLRWLCDNWTGVHVTY